MKLSRAHALSPFLNNENEIKNVGQQQRPTTAGGRIHVIDGILDWPAGSQANLLDIMDTLKQCDKFDGFVTLAQGTGLTQVLKQGKSVGSLCFGTCVLFAVLLQLRPV